MILLIQQKRFAGICNLHKLIREIGKQELQQKTSCKMLQTLMRMGYITVLRHIPFEKILRFFNFPDTQPGSFVYLMLKKNRHTSAFHLYFAPHKFSIKTEDRK